MDSLDPLKLSRDLEETAKLARRFERRLREGEGFDDDPFFAHRYVSTRETFVAVSELRDDPLREHLRRWVYRMTELRVNQAALCRTAYERRAEERVVDEPEYGRFTLSALLLRALTEGPRRAAWLSSYFRSAAPLSEASQRLWERRSEVASRLGVGAPDAIESVGVDVRSRAEKWLTRTDDLFAEFKTNTLPELIDSALGMDACDGWPNRLTIDSLMSWFRETELFRSLEPDFGRLPQPIGASSFMRALRHIGATWADAADQSHEPFVVAHDPYGLRRRQFAGLFGALPSNPAFAERHLGLPRSGLRDHMRRIARVRLIESRFGALRVLVRAAALGGATSLSSGFEEACERALGFGLQKSAAGTLFVPCIDEAQRFAGRSLAAARAAQLRNDHDDDWFRNPRAVEQLRSEAALSPEAATTDPALDASETALLEALTEALR